MDAKKRKRLEDAGFAVGTPADFLGLGDEETKLVEIRFERSEKIRARREEAG